MDAHIHVFAPASKHCISLSRKLFLILLTLRLLLFLLLRLRGFLFGEGVDAISKIDDDWAQFNVHDRHREAKCIVLPEYMEQMDGG